MHLVRKRYGARTPELGRNALGTRKSGPCPKLHKCFPESRYIITDTSASPMAPLMNIAASPSTAEAARMGAASRITVFANGLTGPGAMGFRPGVFREKAGDSRWSPLWDHFTAVWKDPDEATLLTSQQEIDALVEDGTLELFVGTPTRGESLLGTA